MKHYILEVFYKDGLNAQFIIVAENIQGAVIKMLDFEYEDEVEMLHLEEE